MSNDDLSNPSARRQPLGGRVGTTIVAVTPIVALALFILIGVTSGGWGWAWLFFLAVPVVGLIVYGPGTRQRE